MVSMISLVRSFRQAGSFKPGESQNWCPDSPVKPDAISQHLKLVIARPAGFRYLVTLFEQIPICGIRPAVELFPFGRCLW